MIDLRAYGKTLEGRPVAVFGLARSGLSSIKALQQADIKTIAWDDQETARETAKSLGAEIALLDEKTLKPCAFMLLAPGVPLDHAVVKAAQAAGTEIICDIELLHRLNHGRKTIGVTGTNGKSTTTALIHHILKSAGRDVAMGGNIGVPVFDLEMPSVDGIFVFELSSYQLDLCPTYRPDIAILLNITPDHIDRHGSLENYVASKKRIFDVKGINDTVAIIGIDDEQSRAIYNSTKSHILKTVTISVNEPDMRELKRIMKLKGDHNYQNALAAYKACNAAGLMKEEILDGLSTFPGLPHRQYPVRTSGRITYINDSKATNAEATAKALQSYDNIYWIVGGRAKEGGLKGLESFAPRIQEAFLIGEAANDFAVWMSANNIKHQDNKTLDAAVNAAHGAAQKASTPAVVLLSPACASFDQFKSYEERGDKFSSLVNALEESAAA